MWSIVEIWHFQERPFLSTGDFYAWRHSSYNSKRKWRFESCNGTFFRWTEKSGTPSTGSVWDSGSCICVAVLWGFAWFFTGKMLGPLEENRKRQTQFIAAASHELRSPTGCDFVLCSGYGDRSRGKQEIYADYKKRRKQDVKAGRRYACSCKCRQQILSILKSPCELDTLILDTYEKYEPLLREKKISIEAVLPEEVAFLPVNVTAPESAR